MQKIIFKGIILVILLQSCKQKSIEIQMEEHCECLNRHFEKKLKDHSECDLLLREIYARQSENLDSLNLIEAKKTQCWFQF